MKDSQQTQNLITKITENPKFKDKNNFFVMNFKLKTETEKCSEINFIFMPFHYVLIQVLFLTINLHKLSIFIFRIK